MVPFLFEEIEYEGRKDEQSTFFLLLLILIESLDSGLLPPARTTLEVKWHAVEGQRKRKRKGKGKPSGRDSLVMVMT